MHQNGPLLVESRDGVRVLTLNRPRVRNALDGRLSAELCTAFQEAATDIGLRAVVLGGAGSVFCAGADLAWVARAEVITEAERLRDADLFLRLFRAIDDCPLPVIGRVQGAAYGGGVGLLAACDAVVAADDTQFALREVRVGLVPAIIAPLLVRTIGMSQARRYCLTGEPFSANTAQRIGLVHEVVVPPELDGAVEDLVRHVQEAGPQAVRETKALL
ncbi:MAG: enoyl-CoA hydratase-related protein, partial [Nitrospirales bacterium]